MEHNIKEDQPLCMMIYHAGNTHFFPVTSYEAKHPHWVQPTIKSADLVHLQTILQEKGIPLSILATDPEDTTVQFNTTAIFPTPWYINKTQYEVRAERLMNPKILREAEDRAAQIFSVLQGKPYVSTRTKVEPVVYPDGLQDAFKKKAAEYQHALHFGEEESPLIGIESSSQIFLDGYMEILQNFNFPYESIMADNDGEGTTSVCFFFPQSNSIPE